MYPQNIKIVASIILASLFASTVIQAENLEILIRSGYDSNVIRSVNAPQANGYLNAVLSWTRPADPQKTVAWTMTGLSSSAAYFETQEENYISFSLLPGISYSPFELLQINISSIIEASAVKDTNQSEVSLGAVIYFSQQLTDRFYVSEFAEYTDSKAKKDIYSQNEFSAGGYFGINITETLYAEAGYKYSYGTSYQSSSIPLTKDKGKHSSALDYDVYQNRVNGHALSFNTGLDLTEKFFTTIGYTFAYTKGEIGISRSHDASAGIGYRF